MFSSLAVFAHQGGWDEMLFVLLPICLFAGLLAIANKRATKMQQERDATENEPVTEPETSDTD